MSDGDGVGEAREFYRGLYDVLDIHRTLIKALLAAQEDQGPLAGSEQHPPHWVRSSNASSG